MQTKLVRVSKTRARGVSSASALCDNDFRFLMKYDGTQLLD
jgi:hypothetical protein